MRAGPKPAASRRALPLTGVGVSAADDVAAWLARWVRVPRGRGAGGPFVLRDWQLEVVAGLLAPETRLAVLVCARGNGKSGLAAAVALHHAVEGPAGATAAVVSTDERASGRMLRSATRMVEESPSLSKRVTVYADRLVSARNGGEFLSLPAEARRVEGSDLTLAIADEAGLCERATWESLLLSLKREGSRALAIGTPSPWEWADRAPLADLVAAGRARDDPSLRLTEFGSDPSHAVTCWHCVESSSPGLGDLLDPSQVLSSLPPKTRESEFRRARLGQWPTAVGADPFLPMGAWASCVDGRSIPDHAEVCLALDGSFSGDATALLAVTVEARPHVEVVGLWEAPEGDAEWRASMTDVEAAILSAAARWSVVEMTADPFRWARSLEVIAAAGVPTTEFPQSAARMGPATQSLRDRILAADLTHDGDSRLAQHVANAVLRDDSRGVRLAKASKHSRRRIDLAVCLVMGVSRASWLHGHRVEPKRKRVYSW